MGKVRRHISIEEEQDEWVEEMDINLSSLVRSAIDRRRED